MTKQKQVFRNFSKSIKNVKQKYLIYISIQTLCYETWNWAQVHPVSIDHPVEILSRHRSGEGYQNISAALKVPKNTVASTKLLPPRLFLELADQAKLRNWGRRALVREVTKNPKVTLTKLQSCSMEMGEPSRRTTISAALHQSGLYGSGQTEATLK